MVKVAVLLGAGLLLLGCSPMSAAVIGGASSLWQKNEMMNLEKRVRRLENSLRKLQCDPVFSVKYVC